MNTSEERNRSKELFEKHIRSMYETRSSSTTLMKREKKLRINKFLLLEEAINSLRRESILCDSSRKKFIAVEIKEMMKQRNDIGGNRRWIKNYSLSSVDGDKTVLVGCKYALGTIEDAFEDLEQIH